MQAREFSVISEVSVLIAAARRTLVLSVALLLLDATGAAAQELKPVRYICADGTKIQATFTPVSNSPGSVELIFTESADKAMTLPQAVSASGGRYARGDVEFWIKGEDARLIRMGKTTACRTDG